MEEKKEVQEIQEEVVRISVRNLVEFILREGDLDNRQGGTAESGGYAAWRADSPKDSKADGKRISCGSAFADDGAL